MVKFTTSSLLRTFWLSILLTIIATVFIHAKLGDELIWLFLILTLLEITFSFDNAAINSKILARMSPFWQQMFLTVGILFAVFIVRLILPIAIVSFSSDYSLTAVLDIALNDHNHYSEILHSAGPLINAFGGSFLVMVAFDFLINRDKKIHWLPLESRLARLGSSHTIKYIMPILVALTAWLLTPVDHKLPVIIAATIGVGLHVILAAMNNHFESRQPAGKRLVGLAAFVSFIYLNVLDASFSLDGVIGAFAITSNVILIMVGLGVGAIWIRSLTIYLVRAGTLVKYRYLEHGAYWAIFILGAIMLAKLASIELPEWLIGSVGLMLIAAAITTSTTKRR